MEAAVNLDRRVQFRRKGLTNDGFGFAEWWENVGDPIPAHKEDVSDGERWRAGEVAAHITTRFVIRWSAFAESITPADRLVFEGREFDISGVKEPKGSRRKWIEITAAARSDLAQ
jgi:head-tail adaptor